MAISGGDGSIILTTKVDQSGLNKGMTSMQKDVKSLSSSFKALGSTIAAVFSVTAIINFSKQAGEFATQTEASAQRLVDIYGEAAQSVGDFIDANARAIGMSKSAGASIAATYGNLLSVWADQETNAQLTNNLLNQTAVVASKTGRTTTDVAERIRSGLLGNTEAIEDLGINVNIKTIEITDAFKRISDGRSWEQLNAYEQAQVRTLTILEQSTNKYGTTVAETTATVRNQYQAAYEDFQNTWGQVVNTVLIPVLKILTQVFTIVTKGLQVMAGLGGKTVENSGQTSSNIKQQTKEQEKLNKAVKRGLAGFDEINLLAEETAKSQEDSANSSQDIVVGGGGGGDILSTVGEINSTLALIMGVVGGAMIAIGLLLLFTGNVAWGLGFIIFGGITMAVTIGAVSGTNIDEETASRIASITKIVGVSMIAIGLLLLFLGQIPWGLGFIAAGAGLVSVSEIFPTTTSEDVKSNCDAILAFLAGLTAYLVAYALLKNWATFVALWKDFRALMQLIHTEGFFKTITGLFGGSLGTMQLWAIAIGVVVGSIAYLALNWDKLSPAQRVITILSALAAAATAAAVAIALFHTAWSVGIAAAAIAGGIALLAGTYLFKKANTKTSLSGGGKAPAGISQYAYLAEGGTYSLPHLAQGAVIPPNREFLAVLGDQKHGTNIEAPLDTIKQAVAEVLAQVNVGGGFNGTIEVPVIIDGREIARATRNGENRLGKQTVFGGFANAY